MVHQYICERCGAYLDPGEICDCMGGEKMSLKAFSEMRKIDVKPYCKKRDGKEYLPWATCKQLLHDNGAQLVYWEPIPDPVTGSSLRHSDVVFTDKNGISNRCYETRILIVIDEHSYEMQTPVMNGNNPVRDNSMTQLRVWNSMCRAFVKGVAIHTGLGFDLWLREEAEEDLYIPEELDKPASASKIRTIKQMCHNHGLDGDAWVAMNNRTWESMSEREAAMMLNALKERYGDD